MGSERRRRERKVLGEGLRRRKRRVVWEFGLGGTGERRMEVGLEGKTLRGKRAGGGGGGNKWRWW